MAEEVNWRSSPYLADQPVGVRSEIDEAGSWRDFDSQKIGFHKHEALALAMQRRENGCEYDPPGKAPDHIRKCRIRWVIGGFREDEIEHHESHSGLKQFLNGPRMDAPVPWKAGGHAGEVYVTCDQGWIKALAGQALLINAEEHKWWAVSRESSTSLPRVKSFQRRSVG